MLTNNTVYQCHKYKKHLYFATWKNNYTSAEKNTKIGLGLILWNSYLLTSVLEIKRKQLWVIYHAKKNI